MNDQTHIDFSLAFSVCTKEQLLQVCFSLLNSVRCLRATEKRLRAEAVALRAANDDLIAQSHTALDQLEELRGKEAQEKAKSYPQGGDVAARIWRRWAGLKKR